MPGSGSAGAARARGMLEGGWGPGHGLARLTGHGFTRLAGVDPSLRMLASAIAGVTGADLRRATAESLP